MVEDNEMDTSPSPVPAEASSSDTPLAVKVLDEINETCKTLSSSRKTRRQAAEKLTVDRATMASLGEHSLKHF